MKKLYLLVFTAFAACNSTEKSSEKAFFSEVEVETLYEDSVSVRALEIIGDNVAFAGSNGVYGLFDAAQERARVNQQIYDSIMPDFRAVASTEMDFFMLSAGNPALLYKTGDMGDMELVYREEHEDVFYDSMTFWNEQEGIAMGDPISSCLSIIITRDGGKTWNKLPCDALPETEEGEAAFAASDSNIAVVGERTWIISGGMASRVFYSPDKGDTWEVYETPLVHGQPTTGAYSVDFFDENNGVIIGGDYTNPEENSANKAITTDGGQTWELISQGTDPGYKSSVRYVPNSGANEMVAVGFTGIAYSFDRGQSWMNLSDEGFYTLRFLNDSVAYAAGQNRLSRLTFR